MPKKKSLKKMEMEYNAEVTRRIAHFCAEQRVSQTELANAADVTLGNLWNWTHAKARWPVFRVRLIADYLGVPLGSLMPKTTNYVISLKSTPKAM